MSARKLQPMLSSENDEWGTPRPFFDSINRALGLELDVAARSDQRMTLLFWSKRDQATRRPWGGRRYWMNPPYSKVAEFTRHARAETMKPDTLGAWLVPARPDTNWWRDHVLQLDGKAGELVTSRFVPETGALWLGYQKLIIGVRWVKGRITFRLPPGSKAKSDPAPFPSAVVIAAHLDARPLIFGSEWTKGWPW